MAWSGSFKPFTSQPPQLPTFSFLYNCDYVPFPGEEGVKFGSEADQLGNEKSSCEEKTYMGNKNKRRLRNDQTEMLERSFQEEIKLEPERKMKLAKELDLHPRQVAVWFQNRRSRWKTQQMHQVYDALKLDYEAISAENQKLQEEVVRLKAKLAAALKQGSTGSPEVSLEETVESTAAVNRKLSENKNSTATISDGIATAETTRTDFCEDHQEIPECNDLFNIDDYNPALPPYWAVFPGYP